MDNRPLLYIPEQTWGFLSGFKLDAKRKIVISYKDWRRMAEYAFGLDMNEWKFICPSCGYIASIAEYRKVGAPSMFIGKYCIGNHWIGANKNKFQWGKGPCLFKGDHKTNPVNVVDTITADDYMFHFALDVKYVEGSHGKCPTYMEDRE